ncbi:centrosome-associated zinc finger protein CP190 isoform X2 [Anopheles ziemanni]|uniref:centrosome-associated zinc finger protein CP190 isoform X2 n=1 Tax=Anopheles coustani TaxID=139045 RepID=UPI0026581F88|nr:centrosome-associated zinc finger protein CP190 isoform X2 [Anopheles coustani]XP_058174566.1 centrosome-associated zinc finger protein CP190 isoform X2 [Anopheles ziemanni]
MSKMTRYAEAKSVKVDNWGVFFLQKLQNFFNKTDHCDLTLQFNDNSQLKVHRLVLSACTDYFNHLENVCEMYDDVLIMPMDLQADVIVPIVNFMYTGTLEFQYNMYDRLLKTATDMNMTVLLKLLEAHRQTSRIAKQPVLLNKQAPRPVGRSMPVNMFPSAAQRNQAQANRGRPRQQYSHTKDVKPGPSRFDDTDLTEGFEGSFDTISYESKPLLTADQVKKEEEASPFEKLRKGYTNVNVVKRTSSGSVTSPPAKKPNLDEVKEFTEAARLRSQLTTDDDDSPDYVDDDTHFNDDDDEDYQPPASLRAALAKAANQQAGGGKQIVIKQEVKSPGNTMKQITVNDSTGNVDHAKIISEVLKKYPHLVKKNKNIKLKIMQKGVPAATTSISQAVGGSTSSASTKGGAPTKMEIRTATPLKQDMSMVRKASANIRSEQAKPAATGSGSSVAGAKPGAPKTIDAKTMHALIAKGAENMTGPWLCLRCGINGRPISIPNYKAFRNHLIVKHKERIDPRICEHCGFKAEHRNPNLLYHWYTEHKIKSALKFPECDECDYVAMNASALQKHEEEHHTSGEMQHCIYCNKVFAKEMELYYHMKEQHKQRALTDGVLDFTDDDEYQEEQQQEVLGFSPGSKVSAADAKIKILSNITLPPAKGISLEPSSEAEALSNVATGIATSLGLVGDNGVVLDDANYQNQFIEAELASVHGESAVTLAGSSSTVGGENIITKLVTEDGTELQLTQSQKDEIISQLQNPSANNVVMVLNEDNFADGSTLQLGEGVQIVNTASTDNQNLMLMYSQESASENNDSQKSETKADVTMASEDDNSQVSMTLSEDRPGTADGKRSMDGDTPMEEGDESQESRKTDATDKDEHRQEQQEQQQHGEEQEDDDADMSAELTSETNENSLQQAAKDAGIEEDDSKSTDGKNADEQSEERQKSDKLKLISELEGDWSEDTAEEQATPPAKVVAGAETTGESGKKVDGDSRKSAAAVVAASKKSPEHANKKKESPNAEGKDIDKLLDDWNNEVKLGDSDSADEGDLEKKMEKVIGTPPADSALDKSSGSLNESALKKEKNNEQKEVKAAVESKDKAEDKNASAGKKLETEKPAKVVDGGSSSQKTKKNGTTTTSDAPVKMPSSDPEDDAAVADDPEDEDDDDEKDKTSSKSKEVSSLIGEWDEDDDL